MIWESKRRLRAEIDQLKARIYRAQQRCTCGEAWTVETPPSRREARNQAVALDFGDMVRGIVRRGNADA